MIQRARERERERWPWRQVEQIKTNKVVCQGQNATAIKGPLEKKKPACTGLIYAFWINGEIEGNSRGGNVKLLASRSCPPCQEQRKGRAGKEVRKQSKISFSRTCLCVFYIYAISPLIAHYACCEWQFLDFWGYFSHYTILPGPTAN